MDEPKAPVSTVISEKEQLVDTVYEQVGNPISIWAVAATIESLGIRDVDARNDFGYNSVFDLAEDVYGKLKERVKNEPAEEEEPTRLQKLSLAKRARLFVKYYWQGILFSLPMISQVAAILIFRYSLWAWLEFNEAQATVVAFGTIVAFVITGGFTQTLGRSVTRYISETDYFLAYEATRKIMKGGVVTTVLVAIFFYLLNLVIPFYPHSMIVLALIYYILISLLLLASGVLYALEQRAMILFIILGGTGVVIAGMDLFHLGIYLAHWLGMGITILLLASYGYLYFKIKIRVHKQDLSRQSLPTTSIRYYINYRYFVYGFLYFFFLFLDRILAWSAGPPPPPYIIWFNTPYELGMDWALVSLIFTIAVLEYSVQAFSRQLMDKQKGVLFSHLDDFNSYFRNFYRRQLVLLVIIGTISIVATFFAIESLRVLQDEIPEIRDFFTNPMTTRVFWMASISYLFVVIGLLHSLFFFTLNKPAFAMYSIGGAFVVNFFVGFICSRIWGLEYAALGLLAGALAFALISGAIARNFFRHLDYYYYSAF